MFFFILCEFVAKMSGNENLLDGLFREEEEADKDASDSYSSSSSSEDDGVVEAAEKLVALAQNDVQIQDKWIMENGHCFFYDSHRSKLLLFRNNCYFEYEGDGEFHFAGRPADDLTTPHLPEEADPVTPHIPPTNPASFWITSIPKSFLTIRYDTGDFSEKSSSPSSKRQKRPYKISAFEEFLHKYNFDDSFVRHILKMDRFLVSYIIPRFNPVKAKPKNAFSNFCDSLITKFPQPWRWKAMVAIPEEERAAEGCETKPLRDIINFGSFSEKNDFEIAPQNFSFSAQFFFLGTDVYVMMNQDNSGVRVLVDGVRCLASEGPLGPLKDGSVVAIYFDGPDNSSRQSAELVPDHLFVVECADSEAALVSRRNSL